MELFRNISCPYRCALISGPFVGGSTGGGAFTGVRFVQALYFCLTSAFFLLLLSFDSVHHSISCTV
jgi:hypothetical protein